jgi:hypothetical protein
MRAVIAIDAAILCAIALAGVGSSTVASGKATSTARCPSRKAPPRVITKIQAIQFDLMRRSSFNSFDGRRVARDLLSHRQLWCAVILDRLDDSALIKLRDIDENVWNADTVYVLSSGANDVQLSQLAHRWRADSVYWVSGRAASHLLGTSERFRILEVWWD